MTDVRTVADVLDRAEADLFLLSPKNYRRLLASVGRKPVAAERAASLSALLSELQAFNRVERRA